MKKGLCFLLCHVCAESTKCKVSAGVDAISHAETWDMTGAVTVSCCSPRLCPTWGQARTAAQKRLECLEG